MYNSREGGGGGGGGGSSANYNNDSKYVADILSSMANGDPVPANQYTLPSFVCGVTTATTPTLTPTTLANIEQAFIELQSVPVSTANQDPLTQSGFVPPIVDPVCSTDHIAAERYKYDSDDPDWEPSSKRVKTSPGPSKSTPTDYQATSTTKKSGARRPLKVEKLSPEEEQRRRVRRERNKVAAAKCRQRRVDHTNQLITETEKLEDEKVSLEDEIQALQQQKDQLEFILQAHQPLCKVEKKLSQQQSEQRKIKNEMDAASQCSRKPDALPSRPNSLPLVKQEKDSRAHVAPNGLPISMHHNGYFNFSTLDSIVDNVSTGLTPVNGPSCASQVHRSSSDSGSEALGSPTLISL